MADLQRLQGFLDQYRNYIEGPIVCLETLPAIQKALAEEIVYECTGIRNGDQASDRDVRNYHHYRKIDDRVLWLLKDQGFDFQAIAIKRPQFVGSMAITPKQLIIDSLKTESFVVGFIVVHPVSNLKIMVGAGLRDDHDGDRMSGT